MGFFDDLRLPGGDRDEDEEYVAPDWIEAPQDFVAGVVPVELILARNDEAAISLTRFAAYPAGFELDVELVTRRSVPEDSFELLYRGPRGGGEELPPELVRIGIEFSDGRRTTSLGGMMDGSSTSVHALDREQSRDPETEITMTPASGGGSDRHSYQTYWVWPLPPEGPLKFVCEWPAFGIAETSVELDSALIRDASQRAVSVWAD
jgi:hypothetical protein